ncbi:hypothetical protein [Nocardia sp. NPDC024068]
MHEPTPPTGVRTPVGVDTTRAGIARVLLCGLLQHVDDDLEPAKVMRE